MARTSNAVQLPPALRRLLADARPIMQRLSKQTGLTAKLSVRRGSAALLIHLAAPPLPIVVSGPVGGRFHLAIGASGSCLLSDLPDPRIQQLLNRAPQAAWKLQTPTEVWDRIIQCRRMGLCFDMGQYHPDVRAVAMPLHDGEGHVVAALSLMGLAHDINGSSTDRCIAALQKAARRLTGTR